jgi:hypothetical protein
VDAAYASSAAVNADVVWEPGPTEWGKYRFRVVDPEAYEWTFGTHKPGEPAADWSDQEWDADGSRAHRLRADQLETPGTTWRLACRTAVCQP